MQAFAAAGPRREGTHGVHVRPPAFHGRHDARACQLACASRQDPHGELQLLIYAPMPPLKLHARSFVEGTKQELDSVHVPADKIHTERLSF